MSAPKCQPVLGRGAGASDLQRGADRQTRDSQVSEVAQDPRKNRLLRLHRCVRLRTSSEYTYLLASGLKCSWVSLRITADQKMVRNTIKIAVYNERLKNHALKGQWFTDEFLMRVGMRGSGEVPFHGSDPLIHKYTGRFVGMRVCDHMSRLCSEAAYTVV